jgi:sugar/nucleoside kinase (ribokinase family)
MQPPARWDVVGIGANSIDFVTVVPAFPRPEGWHSKMRIRRHLVSPGGQAATTTAACAKFGLRAKYIGAIGGDENGARVREAFDLLGFDGSGLVQQDARNQYAVIVIDEQTGERAVLWDRDEALRLRPEDVPMDVIGSARLLHVDDVDQEAAIRAARHARSLGIPVTSDLDRLTDRTEELVQAVSDPIFADGLPEQLTGERDHERALRKLRKRHDGLLVVTVGRNGAVALDGDRFVMSPGFAVAAVDTTGSGDVFRAGFIYGLLHDWPVDRMLRMANAAAAVACTRVGAMASIPTLDEVVRLVETGHTRGERQPARSLRPEA